MTKDGQGVGNRSVQEGASSLTEGVVGFVFQGKIVITEHLQEGIDGLFILIEKGTVRVSEIVCLLGLRESL